MRLGIHTSTSGSLEGAARRAADLVANTFQIFSATIPHVSGVEAYIDIGFAVLQGRSGGRLAGRGVAGVIITETPKDL